MLYLNKGYEFLGDAVTESLSRIPAPGETEALGPAPFAGLQSRRPRERILESILEVTGEEGYERVSVKDIIERSQTSRGTFYNHFDGKEDCFVQAYVEASEWLYRRLLILSGHQPGWRESLRVGLAELLEFCANRPATAKAIFIEPHAVGGEALSQHDQLLKRLAEAIEDGRERAGIRGSSSAMTSAFLVAAIETLIVTKLSSGEAQSVPELLPGMLHFVVIQYLGKDAAWEEMTAASLATWDARRRAASEAS